MLLNIKSDKHSTYSNISKALLLHLMMFVLVYVMIEAHFFLLI